MDPLIWIIGGIVIFAVILACFVAGPIDACSRIFPVWPIEPPEPLVWPTIDPTTIPEKS